MDRPTRSIFVALAALLLPCVGVGWYLVVQVSQAEEVLSLSYRRQAEASLGRAAPAILRAVESSLRDKFASLKLDRVDQGPALRALETSDRSIDHAFLLDPAMKLVQPRLPDNPGLQGFFARPPGMGPRPEPGGPNPHLLLWEHARILESVGDLEGAIAVYREILDLIRKQPQPDQPRLQNAQIRIHAILGALLDRAGQPGAEEEFSIALAKMSGGPGPGGAGPGGGVFAAIKVSCLFQKARITLRQSPAEGARYLLSLGDTIAKGFHDEVLDEVLEHTMDEIEGLIGQGPPEIAAAWRSVREEDAWRLEGRAFAAELHAFGLPFLSWPRVADPRMDLVCVDWSTNGKPALLAVQRLPENTPAPGWAGLHLDLRSLALDTLLQLLDDKGSIFRLDILTPGGDSLTGDSRAPTSAETDNTGPQNPALRSKAPDVVDANLQWPLQGYVLRAQPRDPASMAARARELLLGKILLVVVLFLVAGLGAVFLVRVVRREAELSRLKMEFVSRVSHELKTPLALIRMYGDTLAMGRAPEPERVSKFAGIIAKEADRLTRMIDNVLDFSRVEAGTKEYRPEVTDLATLIEGVAATYEPHLREKGFGLELEARPMSEVVLDREAMIQCFINLVDNAIKYTDEGERVVRIRTFAENGHAVVEFADRGIGVPAGEREKIFQKFYRASTAGERPGAGLGLALVRHFVQAHGGEVHMSPRDGGGSVFTVSLPASGTAPDDPAEDTGHGAGRKEI